MVVGQRIPEQGIIAMIEGVGAGEDFGEHHHQRRRKHEQETPNALASAGDLRGAGRVSCR
jgi:hypothetical protein